MKCERCGSQFPSDAYFAMAGICQKCFDALPQEEKNQLGARQIHPSDKTFDILVREEDGKQVGTAVKQGFCWPGLFFTFFWAFANRLWLLGTVLALVITAFNVGVVAFTDEMPAVSWIFALLNTGVAVFVGLKGNGWREARRAQEGFRKLKTVRGSRPSQVLVDRGIPEAPSLAYSMGALVTGTIFASLALFSVTVGTVALIYGDLSFAGETMTGLFLTTGVPAVLLWIRAFRPPVGFLRGLAVTYGGLSLGIGNPGFLPGAGAGPKPMAVTVVFLGLGLVLALLGFRPKRR